MFFSSVLESVGCDGRILLGWGKDDLLVLNIIQSSEIDDYEPYNLHNESDNSISNGDSVENSKIIIVSIIKMVRCCVSPAALNPVSKFSV
jgi:hypothetical protein